MQLRAADRVTAQHGAPVEQLGPSPVTGASEPGHEPAAPPEPTPWATGLTVSAIFTFVVTVAGVALHRGFADSGLVRGSGLGWLPGVATVLVGLGVAPSLWILARKPFWRWVAYGIAAGILVAWLLLLLGALLGPGR